MQSITLRQIQSKLNACDQTGHVVFDRGDAPCEFLEMGNDKNIELDREMKSVTVKKFGDMVEDVLYKQHPKKGVIYFSNPYTTVTVGNKRLVNVLQTVTGALLVLEK